MRLFAIFMILLILIGCSKSTDPGEVKTFKLSSGGYRGESVGDCSQAEANELCQERGYTYAIDWTCGTEHVSGGFWGSWDQDVMYCITCWRRG